MARTDKTKSLKAALPFSAGLLVAFCAAPALAQAPSQQAPAQQVPAQQVPAQEQDGYHTLPKQFLLNRWISPSEETKKEQVQEEAKEQVEQTQAEEVRAQTGESVYGQTAPNQYLVNRFFGSGNK